MITYAKIALALFSMLQGWIRLMEKNGYIAQGRAEVINANLEREHAELKVALAARQKVRDIVAADPGSLRKPDPFQRED